jgi:hypothetical protein
MDTVIVDKYALHPEIRLLAVFLLIEFYKCILQTITCSFVADNFARENLAEAAEDELQIVIYTIVSGVSVLRLGNRGMCYLA